MAETTNLDRETRVRWSDEERARIVRRAMEIRSEQPGIGETALLKMAQDVLPPARRRSYLIPCRIGWFAGAIAATRTMPPSDTSLTEGGAELMSWVEALAGSVGAALAADRERTHELLSAIARDLAELRATVSATACRCRSTPY